MDWQALSMWVTAIATLVIAVYAIKAHDLSREIKKLSEKSDSREQAFKKQLKELYKAIVISNMPCAGANSDDKLKEFVKLFKARDSYFDDIFDDQKHHD